MISMLLATMHFHSGIDVSLFHHVDNSNFLLSRGSSEMALPVFQIPLNNCTDQPVVNEPFDVCLSKGTSAFRTPQSCPSLHSSSEIPRVEWPHETCISCMNLYKSLSVIISLYYSFFVVAYVSLAPKITGKRMLWKRLAHRLL